MVFQTILLLVLIHVSHSVQPNVLLSSLPIINNKPLSTSLSLFNRKNTNNTHVNTRHLATYYSIRGGASSSSSSSYNYLKNFVQPTNSQSKYPSSSSSSSSTTSSFSRESSFPIVEDVTLKEEENEREIAKEYLDSFLRRQDRNSFIARVYAILTGQLSVTAFCIFLFKSNPSWQRWMILKGRFVPLLSLGLSTLAWTIMTFLNEKDRQSSPLKWNLLALFTIGEAISVSFISSFYKTKSIIHAMLATGFSTAGITGYMLANKNPKYDLTQWGAGLSSMLLIFLFYGVMHLLGIFGIIPSTWFPYNEMVYSIIGASLFSLYLAHHTRLIITAGKHSKYRINDKDYVFGAMLLYNDIINIFLYLLRLLGEDDD